MKNNTKLIREWFSGNKPVNHIKAAFWLVVREDMSSTADDHLRSKEKSQIRNLIHLYFFLICYGRYFTPYSKVVHSYNSSQHTGGQGKAKPGRKPRPPTGCWQTSPRTHCLCIDEGLLCRSCDLKVNKTSITNVILQPFQPPVKTIF